VTPYDPADPDAVAAEERRLARERQRDLADLRAVLEWPAGRRLIWRVLSQAQPFNASYDESPTRMAFAEGRRNVGLWLLAELQAASPGEFATLIAEASRASAITEDEDSDT
jgi:hypothetical protein